MSDGPTVSRASPAAKHWADPETFTTSLVALLVDTYGLESVGWDPATIQMEVEGDAGVRLPQVNFEKLMVGVALLTTNSFFVSPADFAQFCVVLSGHATSPGVLVLPDADDVAWGITEALLLSPPDDGDE